jgi:tetratricopeptide (TPR) repeat protein
MEGKHILMPILRVAWISLPRLFCPLCLFLLPATPFAAYQIAAPFWASKIDSGFYQRDAYFKSVLPDTANFSLILLNTIQRQLLCDRLTSHPDTLSPWYHFIEGILECGQQKTSSSTHFATALALTKQDPGTTWALFVEFTRNRQTVWAERCLMHLEKLFLASGATRAPAIAQQLLFYAYQHEKEKELTAAFSYYAWAERFDPHQVWSGIHRLRNCIPSHPQLFFTTLGTLYQKGKRSWHLQLEILSLINDGVRIFFLVILIALFAGLGLKYISPALHPIADRLPESIPTWVRSWLPVTVLLSFLSFGLFPFLWLVAICIWRFLELREKLLLTIALFLLAGTPLAARIQDMFLQARAHQGSLTLYSRAALEGYQSDLHQLALKKIIVDPSDALAHLAAALFAAKQNDTAAARLNIRKALDLKPGDRVILTWAGNIEYLAGDNSAAVAFYQQVLTAYPDDMVVRFNLSQCYARNSDTTMDLDFMKMLGKREQTEVNDFINANNVYFSSAWPLLRQVMNPDYHTREFWLTELQNNSGSWKTTRNVWGLSFLGLAPIHSLYISFALLIALFVWSLTSTNRKGAREATRCRLCGKAVCATCSKGELCPSCTLATQFIRNVKTLAAIQSKIMHNRHLFKSLRVHLLDIALPGVGMLYEGKVRLLITVPVVALSAAVYATIFFVSGLHLAYPHWVAYGIMEKYPFFLFFYNGLFVIGAIYSLSRGKEKVLA